MVTMSSGGIVCSSSVTYVYTCALYKPLHSRHSRIVWDHLLRLCTTVAFHLPVCSVFAAVPHFERKEDGSAKGPKRYCQDQLQAAFEGQVAD